MMSRALPFHSLGGMEMIAWDLACQFVKNGLLVTFLTTEIPGRPEQFNSEGVRVVALKGTRPGCYSRLWWKKSRDYFEKCLADNVSIIFSVSAAAYGLTHRRKSFKNIPIILQVHGTSLSEIKSKWKTLSPKAMLASIYNLYCLIKDLYYYPKFDKIVAISDAVFNDLKRFVSLDKLDLIYNGIDHHLFWPDLQQRKTMRQLFGFNAETKVFISMSRLHSQKGVKHAIKAFAEYLKQNPDAYYLVLGEGPERPALEEIARQLKVDQHILFQGAIERSKLNAYLAAADVFLFTTTRCEGLTLNVMEALAAGLPVILSQHSASTIDVKEGIYPVDSGDVLAVAKLMEQVLTNNNSCRQSLLHERYTLAFCANDYCKRYW